MRKRPGYSPARVVVTPYYKAPHMDMFTSPEFWLNLQVGYDLRRLRATVWPKLERRIRPRTAA